MKSKRIRIITDFLLLLSRPGNHRSPLEIFFHCRTRLAPFVAAETHHIERLTLATVRISSDDARKKEKKTRNRQTVPFLSAIVARAFLPFGTRARKTILKTYHVLRITRYNATRRYRQDRFRKICHSQIRMGSEYQLDNRTFFFSPRTSILNRFSIAHSPYK